MKNNTNTNITSICFVYNVHLIFFFTVIIDKDQKPLWQPSTIQEVTDDKVDWYFSKLAEDKEWKLPWMKRNKFYTGDFNFIWPKPDFISINSRVILEVVWMQWLNKYIINIYSFSFLYRFIFPTLTLLKTFLPFCSLIFIISSSQNFFHLSQRIFTFSLREFSKKQKKIYLRRKQGTVFKHQELIMFLAA